MSWRTTWAHTNLYWFLLGNKHDALGHNLYSYIARRSDTALEDSSRGCRTLFKLLSCVPMLGSSMFRVVLSLLSWLIDKRGIYKASF